VPDWSYQTVFRPALLRMPVAAARRLALGTMGTLSRVPLGGAVIDFLGHMRPPPDLAVTYRDVMFPSPVGLGAGIDPACMAPAALARFGFGCLEIGPVTLEPITAGTPPTLAVERASIVLDNPDVNPGLAEMETALSRARLSIPVLVRVGPGVAAADFELSAAQQIVDTLAAQATGFAFQAAFALAQDSNNGTAWQRFSADIRVRGQLVLIVVAAQEDADADKRIADMHTAGTIDGVVIDAASRERGSWREMAADNHQPALAAAGKWRQRLGDDALIVATGGVHQPLAALELQDAGADIVNVDSGLVLVGPGLPKRINEAVSFRKQAMTTAPDSSANKPAAQFGWFWSLMMGLSMSVGGLLAMIVAITRVVLPYDETIAGMTRDELAAINDRLLPFMTHDRVSLAGTMLSVGVLYIALSVFAARRGEHWAHVAMACSAMTGFLSFFLFLGFGYFDPFHAFVTAVMFQFLLLSMHAPLPRLVRTVAPSLLNDWRWRLSQWGQLLFVIHGAALIMAGLTIAKIGITHVFVPEDMEFMQTTAAQLSDAHPGLLPLVAHDRATFGGMLIACGVAVLLLALWGFSRRRRWLWWALFVAGNIAYLATIAVHLDVGYLSLKHLLPAYGGLATLWLGAALTHPFLCAADEKHDELWRRLTSAGTP
jgi:dihydroorotate dehydrogenase